MEQAVVIGPDTVVLGLLCADLATEGHVARIHNYLLGHNQLDGAYLSFVVTPARLAVMLDGMLATGRPRILHVSPSFHAAVGRQLGAATPVERVETVAPPRWTAATSRPGWLEPGQVVDRAVAELAALFGRPIAVPPDVLAVVEETGFRPCVLTHVPGEAG